MNHVCCEFVSVPAAEARRLERLVTKLVLLEARAHAYARGLVTPAQPKGNRRRAYRVAKRAAPEANISVRVAEPAAAEDLTAVLQHAADWSLRELHVVDLSITGCRLEWPTDATPPVGSQLMLEIAVEEVSVAVTARVVALRPGGRTER